MGTDNVPTDKSRRACAPLAPPRACAMETPRGNARGRSITTGAFMRKEAPITISVPEAGKRYFGLCRNAAYDAAARGDIPVIKIGRLLRVPVRALELMLDRAGEKLEQRERAGMSRSRKAGGTSA